MDAAEFFILLGTMVVTAWFLIKWYRCLFLGDDLRRQTPIRWLFGMLPFVVLAGLSYTLRVWASFDVVDDELYRSFYTVIGFSWLALTFLLMRVFFDLSWIDDALHRNNHAAAIALIGGALGGMAIYCGANVGDGPGWWCVAFAGLLGLGAWALLGCLTGVITRAFTRITVGRDVDCGIRFGGFLLASGLLLARASAGDWTSAGMTVVEFGAGWPVLPLTALFILVERLWARGEGDRAREEETQPRLYSVLWALFQLLFAIVAIALLPAL
ncbi:MAG: hypothetical protein FWE69_01200 [Clostridiales bacterium]|nr:hypothetical protein [Clostridiales bacterium]